MRNASKLLIVVVAAMSVGACVNREAASNEPPGESFSAPPPVSSSEASQPPEESQPPSSESSAPGGPETAVECTADDITVAGAPGAKPQVTLPTTCSAPTKLVVKDITPGTGAEAVEGAAMQAHYVLTAWSTGQEIEASWTSAEQQPIPVETVGSGLIEAWNQGLVGMKQGGRRLLVAPPDLAYGGDPSSELAEETLVFVIDAVAVTGP